MKHTLEECREQFPIRSFIYPLKNGYFRLYDARNGEWYDKLFQANEPMKIIGYVYLFNEYVPLVELEDFTIAKFYVWSHPEFIKVEKKVC